MSTGAGPSAPCSPAPIGERRITVDLDNARPFDVVRTWYYLDRAGCYDLEARVSSSGEGFHVRGWIEAADADEDTIERLRLGAGDHPRRVRMDREHTIKPAQVLFSRKGDGEASPWFADPWLAADELIARSGPGPDGFAIGGWSE